jgi:CRISPR/Cas system-associated exonuclease Cas4 (RecB family)
MSHPPVVIDFKTGAEHAEHHEQVAGYLRLLAGISGEEPAGALVYLNANELVVKNVKFATLK